MYVVFAARPASAASRRSAMRRCSWSLRSTAVMCTQSPPKRSVTRANRGSALRAAGQLAAQGRDLGDGGADVRVGGGGDLLVERAHVELVLGEAVLDGGEALGEGHLELGAVIGG